MLLDGPERLPDQPDDLKKIKAILKSIPDKRIQLKIITDFTKGKINRKLDI